MPDTDVKEHVTMTLHEMRHLRESSVETERRGGEDREIKTRQDKTRQDKRRRKYIYYTVQRGYTVQYRKKKKEKRIITSNRVQMSCQA